MASSFVLTNSPQVIWNSWCLDSAMVWFDVVDSQLGASAKCLINSSFQFRPASCSMQAAQSHASVPVCQCCWWWGHSTWACQSQAPCCPHCSGPHSEVNHCLLAGCCCGNPMANPSVPATEEGAPCPHTTHCVNCSSDHSASDQRCPYWQHYFDRNWLVHHTNRDWELWIITSGVTSKRQDKHWDRAAFWYRHNC
ncbi:hypothetical protein AN958_09942 [Leucoagaricus sp. SymC.cos]|nr:hypothetical protein AN958_09942 [Leucoagaricus sp. SymC.cos]